MSLFTNVARNMLDGALLGPGFPLRHVSSLLGRRYHSTTIRRGGRVTFRPDTSDAETFVDIFRRGAYDVSWLRQYRRVQDAYRRIIARGHVPIIIDAGANVGAASLWFAQEFPQAHVYAVEPDPDNAAVLRLNAARNPRIEVVEAAIGSTAGRVTLKNPDHEAWAVQTERADAGDVAVVTIMDLLARTGERGELFLVKVDIEGFEADLFAAGLEWLDRVEVVMIEPHDWLHPGAGTSHNFQSAMLQRPFEVVISGENLVYLRV